MRSPRTRTVTALVVVLTLVIGLVAVVAVAVSRDDEPARTTGPTVLELSRISNVSTEASAIAGGTASVGPYVLDAPPAELAATSAANPEGVVLDPSGSTVSESQVRELLAALGMKRPVLDERTDGWLATGTAAGQKAAFALDERAGNVWQYARGELADCLAIRPGGSPDDAVSCAADRSSLDDQSRRAGPGRAALLREAGDVLDLVGLTAGKGLASHEGGDGTTYLDLPITVEGMPVVDVTVSVAADRDGLVSASGWLDPTFAGSGPYPLIGARAAFDRLQGQPRPELAQVCPDGSTTCSQPRTVTAARLAWLTAQEGPGAHGAVRTVLVPAWQFEVDGFYGPAVVAVSPRLIAGENPGTDQGTDGGGGGSAEPGTAEPGASTGSAPE